MQKANYQVIFEAIDDPIVHAQVLKRCHRLGQEKTVFLYLFIMANTIDVKVHGYLKEGKDIHEAIINGRDVYD